VELRHLHYFLRIAETSSFTAAAASLRVTQPALSHQIRQLEQEVGKPLFDRFGRIMASRRAS
jgi:LysR family cyn operon transcriptional activator